MLSFSIYSIRRNLHILLCASVRESLRTNLYVKHTRYTAVDHFDCFRFARRTDLETAVNAVQLSFVFFSRGDQRVMTALST